MATNLTDISSAVAEQLAERIGASRFELWFSGSSTIDCRGDCIVVRAADEFCLERIRGQFAPVLREIAAEMLGTPAVEFALADRPAADCELESRLPAGRGTPEQVSRPSAIAPEDSSSEHQPGRRNGAVPHAFFFGAQNRLAEAAMTGALEKVGRISPLFFFGPTGCGKSQLLQHLVQRFRDHLRLRRCVYLSAEQFTTNFVESLKGRGLPVFRRKYRDLDVMAVDDLEFLAGKRATLGEFLQTVEWLLRHGKQIIVSSDHSPAELGCLGSDLCNRLASGLVCPLAYPCEQARHRILEHYCQSRQYAIPDPVLRLVASRFASDVRQLFGAVHRLQAGALALGRPLTEGLAESLLADMVCVMASTTSLAKIEQVVCEYCGIGASTLRSGQRTRQISTARMLAMWLSRRHTSSAFSEIGHYYGGRSHSTVISAERKVTDWVAENKTIPVSQSRSPVRDVLRRIEARLRVG